MSSISEGIERENAYIAGLFKEDVELEFYDISHTYSTFLVTSVNGIKAVGKILVDYYDDLVYISDRDIRDGYAGKLTVGEKTSPYGGEFYSQKFRTVDCTNPRYMKLPVEGEKVSLVEFLCKAYLHNWAGGRNDKPEDRGVLQAAVALGVSKRFAVDSFPETVAEFVAWVAEQAPKPEPVVGKLTDEKLIAELMKEYGWSREDTVNGYTVNEVWGDDFAIDGALEIVVIDDLVFDSRHDYGMGDDVDACVRAEKDGVRFINDIDGLEKGRYVDTSENRDRCARQIARHPEKRIDNWWYDMNEAYQAIYVERFGAPVAVTTIESLKEWIINDGLEADIKKYNVPKNEQHAQRWGALYDYVEQAQLGNVKPYITDIVERYEAHPLAACAFLDGLEKGMAFADPMKEATAASRDMATRSEPAPEKDKGAR